MFKSITSEFYYLLTQALQESATFLTPMCDYLLIPQVSSTDGTHRIGWALDTRLIYRLFLRCQEAELRGASIWKSAKEDRAVLVEEHIEMVYI